MGHEEKNDAKLAHAVIAQEAEEGKVHAVAAVSEQLQTPSSVRYIALIKADYLYNGGNWHNNITTLADTCGCENGVNSLFAITNDFYIHNCDKFIEEASVISATGGAVHFKQYIVVHMQIQDKIVESRFQQPGFQSYSTSFEKWTQPVHVKIVVPTCSLPAAAF